MDEFDFRWRRMMDRFWRRRRLEMVAHATLFVVVNVALIFDPYGPPLSASAPDFFRIFGVQNIPWVTIHWTTVLLLHVIVVLSAALWNRVFYAGMVDELSTRYEDTREKPKNDLTSRTDGDDGYVEAYRQMLSKENV